MHFLAKKHRSDEENDTTDEAFEIVQGQALTVIIPTNHDHEAFAVPGLSSGDGVSNRPELANNSAEDDQKKKPAAPKTITKGVDCFRCSTKTLLLLAGIILLAAVVVLAIIVTKLSGNGDTTNSDTESVVERKHEDESNTVVPGVWHGGISFGPPPSGAATVPSSSPAPFGVSLTPPPSDVATIPSSTPAPFGVTLIPPPTDRPTRQPLSPSLTVEPITLRPTFPQTTTPEPTRAPTPEPTRAPTPEPTQTNTPEPTPATTPEPTQTNTPEPTQTTTPEPTEWNVDQCRGRTRLRRAWRTLTCSEQNEFLQAVHALKSEGTYDEFVEVHGASARSAHFIDAFLPWHRWYLWVFERELQRVARFCITVPYWDWEQDDGGLDSILKSSSFGSEHNGGRRCVRDGIAEDWDTVETRGCLLRDFDWRWSLSRDVEVLSRITNVPIYDRFRDILENGPHAGPHNFIGGAMMGDWSPDDPLFWLHHSNVDRIWVLWQDYHDHDEADEYSWEHYSSGDIDSPMIFRADRWIDFDNPNTGEAPTVREVLTPSNNLLNVQYINDSLARQLIRTDSEYSSSGNNPRWIHPASTSSTSEVCRGDDNDDGCRTLGESCSSDNSCCSDFCNSQGSCARGCMRIGENCESNDQCCSGDCGWRGWCVENDRRLLQDEADDLFFDPKLQTRWKELMRVYPDDAGKIFETLAREDCAFRETEEHRPIILASPEWISRMGMENKTKAFECHYVNE